MLLSLLLTKQKQSLAISLQKRALLTQRSVEAEVTLNHLFTFNVEGKVGNKLLVSKLLITIGSLSKTRNVVGNSRSPAGSAAVDNKVSFYP